MGVLIATVFALGLAVIVSAYPPRVASPPKPLTFSILEDYDKGDDLADVARDFALMRELGVRTWRGSFGWDDFEPEPGRYDFTWLHRFIALAASHQMTLRPYVGYTPEWAAGGVDKDGQAWNQPPKSDRAWRRFVSALARELRHHPNVPSLEIYNEQNVAQWWEGSRAEYARTLVGASRAARTERRFQIIHGGLVFPDVEWIEEVCERPDARAAFDIIPVHAYPETWTPDGVTVENYFGPHFEANFAAAVDRACGRKRVWVNETGFATIAGKSEGDQAAWWVRAVATFAARPRIEHIGIYELKDLAPDKAAIGDAPNYHLGITRVDRTPKIAFHTLKRLVALLGSDGVVISPEDAVVEPIEGAGELHHQSFRRPDGTRLLFVWNRTSEQQVRIALPDAATIAEFGVDGAAHSASPTSPFVTTLRPGVPRVYRWSTAAK